MVKPVVVAVTLALIGGTVLAQTANVRQAAACVYRDGGALPDRKCTPGSTNPAVTQGDIGATICKAGWTAVIRPPLAVTEPEKYRSMTAYGDRFGKSATVYEYDHLVPLEVGGAVNDPANLWPEPHAVTWRGKPAGSFAKDGVENHLNALVCSGKMTLARAQVVFETDWRK